ncbi:ABC transporter ATP-binding protein [Haloarchaeobius sp. HRN-SO-5]|uniref:ABC transporter ATP-binding protein n=1 Tax=Haloarchaeobius sp. HRN-SO-5 TaxID=3446118 RepID=UPI003EBD72B7
MARTTRTAAEEEQGVVLRTEGLTKKFGELVAVEDVDFSLERGEFRSVIGPNGAGKTTLFNLISGALPATAGTITFKGEDVTALDPYQRVRRGVARSFQITMVFNGLSVRENVRLAAQSMALDDMSPQQVLFADKNGFEDVSAITDDVLERVGLEGMGAVQASNLAYGDRRRLEIGLVLATDPEVILLDEPTAGMSSDETVDTIELVEDVLADKTLILVEHDVELVMNVSDKITVLHQGQVLAEGTPQEISDNEAVQEAYLGGYD